MGSMQSPGASEWKAARGDKWLAALSGMEPTLRPIDEPLLAALRLDTTVRVADIGCGGGETTIAIARRAPAGSVVHGFDISPSLIDRARGRVEAGDHGKVEFHVADMATAAPPGDRYDRITSRFGVMFFDDEPAAFANIARWLAPGGRVAFAVWSKPADNQWLDIAREIVGKHVEIPTPAPDAPGPFRYGDADKLRTLLTGAGLRDIEVEDWHGSLPIGGGGSPDDAASFALTSFSSFAELLGKAGPGVLEEARSSLAKAFAEYHRDGAVWMEATVHIVTGR